MAKSPGKITPLTPFFLLVFLTVAGISVLCLGISLYLSHMRDPTEQAKQLSDTCNTAFKIGFGAIVGLLGGKAIP